MKIISENLLPGDSVFMFRWSECVHCGACAGICPSGAFSVSGRTFRVKLDMSLCMKCGLCLEVCFYGAIQPAENNMKKGADVQ